MSVSIMYRQKIDFSSCVWMVGFPKFGHIYVKIGMSALPSWYRTAQQQLDTRMGVNSKKRAG